MNFSFSELLVVLLIALLVMKPEQIPGVALSLGRLLKFARQQISKIKTEMNDMITSTENVDEQKHKKP